MRRTIVMLLIVAGVISSAQAAKRVTAAQFEQAVTAFQTKPDAEAAFLIADLQLSERLGLARIARLNAMLTGEKSRQALIAIADASQFQPPPPDQLPSTAAPDLAAQRRIMGLAANYVSKTIPQLPNFMATRTTDFFEDTPLVQKAGDWSTPYQPLHLVGHASATVLYRDGREVEETSKRARQVDARRGLHSYGEFGPILALILVDAAQNKLAFSRWEQGGGGPEAVFSYQVPREKSHYYVDYCCIANEAATGVANTSAFHEIVGYHGEMAVDPERGSILRLSVVAELKTGNPVTRADILVDYGLVEIGGKPYMCPVKGVSITTAQMVQLAPGFGYPLARQLQPLKTMLNDVKFEQYHVFRSESRMLTAENGAPEAPAAEQLKPIAGAGPAAESAVASEVRADASPLPAAAFPAPPAPPATPAEPAEREISVTGNTAVPDSPAQSQPLSGPSGFRLRTIARLVDVGVVAYDKKGRPVTDLKQGDFELYDNGRRQEIKYFGQASHATLPNPGAQTTQPAAPPPEPVYSNRQTVPALQPRTAAAESHATVLLVDASSLAWTDLQNARQEVLRFLKTLAPDEPVGLYILRSYGFQILLEPTTDHALVAKTLSAWMPDSQDLIRAQEEEQRHREHFDTVHTGSDLTNVNGNESPDPSTYSSGKGVAEALAHPTDAKLRDLGSNPERDALPNLINVGRHLAVIPGHKSLVWIASDNVLADWNIQASAKPGEQEASFLHSAALHVQETLNEAHVSIYPLDASQLEAGGVGADIGRVNIVAVGQSDRDKRQMVVGDAAPANKPGRITAQMKQDTHPIQPEFRELAEATGGRALRRAGDIAAELNGIADDGRAAYLISFSPDSPADDKYHLITVKLTARRDLALRYRTGYLYEKEPATLKERFRQAVWKPGDVNDIALTATHDCASGPAGLKLTIAATDLEMAQAGDRWTDKLDIFLIERDDAAGHAKLNGRTLGLRLQPATYQKVLREGIVVDQPLPAKSDAGSFRIVVVDENSGRMGSITVHAASITGLAPGSQ